MLEEEEMGGGGGGGGATGYTCLAAKQAVEFPHGQFNAK